MSNHKFSHFEDKGLHYARCRCGYTTGRHEHRWKVDDDEQAHHKKIERVRAYLDGKNPSVKSQVDYYREKADDPDETPENRRLWRQLADELAPRAKVRRPEPEGSETLFPIDVPEKRVNRSNQT